MEPEYDEGCIRTQTNVKSKISQDIILIIYFYLFIVKSKHNFKILIDKRN